MSTQTATQHTQQDRYQEYLIEFNRLIWMQVDRMLLGVPLIAMVFLQISLASEVFDKDTARELTNLVTIYDVSIGAFDIIGHMIILWMLLPTLQIVWLTVAGLYVEVKA